MEAENIYCNQMFPTLQVSDIGQAIEFYIHKLGFKLQFQWGEPVTYAGVTLDKVSVHLAANSDPSLRKAVVNFVVADANALYRMHQENKVRITVPIADREYGLRDYQVSDPDGNLLGFGNHIYNQGPKIPIKRVDVNVRLEERLTGLLTELAAHKGMSVSGCLEETLLHSFERVGDGVASPHTMSTLDYIQQLKSKHGIDYDTHASYRFEEE
jgi:uncharacterized glyoxalase superfamily protein PhnB